MDKSIYKEFSSLETKHWWFVARRKYISSLIGRFIEGSEPFTFCEVGAGTGGNLEMLSRFAKVDAVEMNQEAVDYITGLGGRGASSVLTGRLPDHMPLESKYKAVFALDVIEHIEQERESLSALMDLVEPGGLLILTVPAYQWLWSEHDVLNHHQRRYTKSNILSAVEHLRADKLYCSYFNSLLFPMAVVQRILSKVSKNKGALTLPSAMVNNILRKIFGAEAAWAGRLIAPFGLSIALVLRKPS